jgi:hypothetical protein
MENEKKFDYSSKALSKNRKMKLIFGVQRSERHLYMMLQQD